MGARKRTLKASSVISTVYQHGTPPKSKMSVKDELRIQTELICPDKTINISLDPKAPTAYITLTGKTKKNFRILLSSKLVQQTIGMPTEFDNKEKIRPYIFDTIVSLYAQCLHETGHGKFTDMRDKSISNYPEIKYRNFHHNLFNILEDPKQESCLALWYKDKFPYATLQPSVLFAWQCEKVFMPQAEKYTDDGTQTGFLNYLLLCLRCGRKNVKNTCAVFEKYKDDLLPQIKSFMEEPNGTKRVHKSVALGEWIIKNITEFNWEMPDLPEEKKISGSMPSGMSAPEEGMPGGGDMIEEGSAKIGSGSPKASGDEKSEEGAAKGDEDPKEDTKESESEESTSTLLKDDIEDQEVCDEIINDFIHDGEDHEWVIAKDEYTYDDTVIGRLDEQIEKFTDSINDVSKFLKLFKGRIKPRDITGFSRGKFDVKAAIRNKMRGGCDVKVFKQSVKRGQDADLAVSLLCDNSGSMSGTKSALCSRAALVLAQACEWADIPFECNAFTKEQDGYDYTSYTIIEKSFKDSFEKAKPFFAINDSALLKSYLHSERHIYTFSGNSEEVNLYYIWKQLAKVDHKTKLLIVMCDGETTGSEEELRQVVNNIEAEDGIVVIGIGIMCNTVASIYPHHKLFNSEEELANDLAPYLVDIISKYAI